MWDKIGNWFRGGLAKQEELNYVASYDAKINASDIRDTLKQAPESAQKILGQQFAPFKNKMVTQMNQLQRSLSNLKQEVMGAETKLQQTTQLKELTDNHLQEVIKTPTNPQEWMAAKNKASIDSMTANQNVDNATKARANAQGRLDYVQKLSNGLKEAHDKIQNNISDGIEYLDNLNEELALDPNRDMFTELPQATSWLENIEEELKGVDPSALLMSGKLQSQNTGSWKMFLKEYARVRIRGDKVVAAWEANPTNQAKLQQLIAGSAGDKARELAQAIQKSSPETVGKLNVAKWVGRSPQQISEAWHLPTIAKVSAAGMGVVGWLALHSSKDISGEFATEAKKLSSIGPNSTAAPIVSRIVQSLNNLSASWEQVDKNLADNPDTAAKAIDTMEPDLDVIANADWNTVVSNCAKKDLAVQTQREILTLMRDKLKTFLAAQSGQSIVGNTGSGIAGIGTAPDTQGNNTSKVQQFLIDQGLSNVQVTGEIDVPTMAALRQLERLFGSWAQDNRFMGRFVDTAGKKIIDYADLMKVNNMMEKYRKR